MSDETETPDYPHIPLTSFVVGLMEQNARDTAFATNHVIEYNERAATRARATLALVRDGISALLDGPYMPTPRALERALYPSEEAIDAAVAAGWGKA